MRLFLTTDSLYELRTSRIFSLLFIDNIAFCSPSVLARICINLNSKIQTDEKTKRVLPAIIGSTTNNPMVITIKRDPSETKETVVPSIPVVIVETPVVMR